MMMHAFIHTYKIFKVILVKILQNDGHLVTHMSCPHSFYPVMTGRAALTHMFKISVYVLNV